MAKSKAHPGFKRVTTKVARKEGISKKRAAAIVASAARNASAKAKKKNPRLKRVKGAKKKKK
jgi:hypothetical protein